MKRSGFKKKSYSEIVSKLTENRLKKSKSVIDTKKVLKRPRIKNRQQLGGIRKLRKSLWKLFSEFIRKRDKYTCFTCGKQATGSGMHAGHFITGATCPTTLYFDEMNVHAQCYHCNINLSGNWVIYEQKMIDKYGSKIVDELKLRRTLEMGEKVYENFYQEKIEYYKIHLQEM